MPRPPRADEAGGLNRGNLRAEIFHKDADFAAFKKILHEGLQLHQIQLFSYQLMPNHYYLILRPLVDGEMSRFMGWVGGTHTMRYHAHYHTSGLGHVYQQRYIRLCAQRGRPLGHEGWVESIASRLNLESSMRPRGRRRVRPLPEKPIKEA